MQTNMQTSTPIQTTILRVAIVGSKTVFSDDGCMFYTQSMKKQTVLL